MQLLPGNPLGQAADYGIIGNVLSDTLGANTSTTSATYEDTGLSITFTPTGSGVKHCLVFFDAPAIYRDTTSGAGAAIALTDGNNTIIKEQLSYYRNAGDVHTSSFHWYVAVTGGTETTLKIRFQRGSSAGTFTLRYAITAGNTATTTNVPILMVLQVD